MEGGGRLARTRNQNLHSREMHWLVYINTSIESRIPDRILHQIVIIII